MAKIDENWDICEWDGGGEAFSKNKKSITSRAVDDEAVKVVEASEILTLQAANINRLCPIPEKGQRWCIVTEKSLNAVSFIMANLERGDIDELFVSVYRINPYAVNVFLDLIRSGRIKRASFVVSNYFKENHKEERWVDLLCAGAEELGFDIAFVHNHTKVVCARRGDDCFVFEGSGNLSNNAKIEVYNYENSKAVFDFHVSWIKKVISNFKKYKHNDYELSANLYFAD